MSVFGRTDSPVVVRTVRALEDSLTIRPERTSPFLVSTSHERSKGINVEIGDKSPQSGYHLLYLFRMDFAKKTMLVRFQFQEWLGLLLLAVCWPLNWSLPGMRTAYLFFPLWVGYVLAVDGLVLR